MAQKVVVIHDNQITNKLIKKIQKKLKIPKEAVHIQHINEPLGETPIVITMGLFCTKHYLPSIKVIGDVVGESFHIKNDSGEYYFIPSYDAHYIVNNSTKEMEALESCFIKAKDLFNVVY